MLSKEKTIHVVGAGLAGSECAYQLAERGYTVKLYEMRPQTMTPAHKTGYSAELVCSNSFGTYASEAAPGQLKWEAEKLGSMILSCAWKSQVPAGQALGMDRVLFSQLVDEKLRKHPRIEFVDQVVKSLDEIPRPCVLATGPLTHESLAKSLMEHIGEDFLYFFDAIAPILSTDSIDMSKAWKASRWGKGTSDYINCPLTKNEYYALVDEILKSEKMESKDFEKNTPYFEGCMPVEAIAERGVDTLRFGPMKPIGLTNPHAPDQRPYAVVQLRQDNREATAYNMVGFQTKMKYPEQKRVFRKIPGLENAEFLKLGSIHRNLYIHSPKKLNPDLSSRKDPFLFLAGQITGVEGYFESTCIGLLVAHFVDQKMSSRAFNPPPRESALGSLLNAVTLEDKDNFQPTNINFGLFPAVEGKIRKDEKKVYQLKRAKEHFAEWLVTEPAFSLSEQTVEMKSLELKQLSQ